MSMAEYADLVDALLGIAPGSPLALLRDQRAAIRQHSEGAYRELVVPGDPGGVSHAERAALALRVALLGRHEALAAHFRGILQRAGTPAELAAATAFPASTGDDRLSLLLRYADLVAATPERCGQVEIDALTTHGLSPQDIVAVTQLIAFVPYQIRLLAGLRALQQETAA
jgi:CMD domain protein